MKDKNIKIVGAVIVIILLYRRFFYTDTTTLTTKTDTTKTITTENNVRANSATVEIVSNKHDDGTGHPFYTQDPILKLSITTFKDIELTTNDGKLTCELYWGSTDNVGWYVMFIPIQPTKTLKKGNYILTQPYIYKPQLKDTLNGTINIGNEILTINKMPVSVQAY